MKWFLLNHLICKGLLQMDKYMITFILTGNTLFSSHDENLFCLDICIDIRTILHFLFIIMEHMFTWKCNITYIHVHWILKKYFPHKIFHITYFSFIASTLISLDKTNESFNTNKPPIHNYYPAVTASISNCLMWFDPELRNRIFSRFPSVTSFVGR